MSEEIDRRNQPGICGVTCITGAIEWVCVRAPHDPVYRRKTGKRAGQYVMGTGAHPERGHPAPADRHQFVNRWPNRRPGIDTTPHRVRILGP